MKDSFILRLPFKEKDFFNDDFILNQKDVDSLKDLAKKEGRSLKVFFTYKLKKIAKENPIYI